MLPSKFKQKSLRTFLNWYGRKLDLNIFKDAFLETTEYANYEKFRVEDRKMDILKNNNKKDLPIDFAKNYQSLNPDYWGVYYKIGLYFYRKKACQLAQE